jgi:hypothetical protein
LCQFAIGAFNVQVFGVTKMQNPDVVAVLVQIFRRYDIGLIQEIRGCFTSFNIILEFFVLDLLTLIQYADSSETAIYSLLTQINNYTGPNYNLLLSPRLGLSGNFHLKIFVVNIPHSKIRTLLTIGNSVSKEQYGFFYRSTTVTLLSSYLYNDTNNVFEREPYPALFRLLDGPNF